MIDDATLAEWEKGNYPGAHNEIIKVLSAEIRRLRGEIQYFSASINGKGGYIEVQEMLWKSEAAHRAVMEAAQKFATKFATLQEAIGGAFAFQQIHGFPYRGENYGEEWQALQDALALVQQAREET